MVGTSNPSTPKLYQAVTPSAPLYTKHFTVNLTFVQTVTLARRKSFNINYDKYLILVKGTMK